MSHYGGSKRVTVTRIGLGSACAHGGPCACAPCSGLGTAPIDTSGWDIPNPDECPGGICSVPAQPVEAGPLDYAGHDWPSYIQYTDLPVERYAADPSLFVLSSGPGGDTGAWRPGLSQMFANLQAEEAALAASERGATGLPTLPPSPGVQFVPPTNGGFMPTPSTSGSASDSGGGFFANLWASLTTPAKGSSAAPYAALFDTSRAYQSTFPAMQGYVNVVQAAATQNVRTQEGLASQAAQSAAAMLASAKSTASMFDKPLPVVIDARSGMFQLQPGQGVVKGSGASKSSLLLPILGVAGAAALFVAWKRRKARAAAKVSGVDR